MPYSVIQQALDPLLAIKETIFERDDGQPGIRSFLHLADPRGITLGGLSGIPTQ